MSGYRPITDVMLLARSKTPYYGAFPAGFLSRAREQLGVSPSDPVLHVCGGRVRDYPFKGFGPNDKTLDLDPMCNPDFLADARDPLPLNNGIPWAAVLIDRPYTEEDAAHYMPGSDKLPNLNTLLKNAFDVIPVGHRVGVLDYLWAHPGHRGREVGVFAVGTGRNGRARWYITYERLE